jgi:hypothetical protein
VSCILLRSGMRPDEIKAKLTESSRQGLDKAWKHRK